MVATLRIPNIIIVTRIHTYQHFWSKRILLSTEQQILCNIICACMWAKISTVWKFYMANASTFVDSLSSSSSVRVLFKWSKYCCIICSIIFNSSDSSAWVILKMFSSLVWFYSIIGNIQTLSCWPLIAAHRITVHIINFWQPWQPSCVYLNRAEIVGIVLISLQFLNKFGILSSLFEIYYILCVGKKVWVSSVNFFQSQ